MYQVSIVAGQETKMQRVVLPKELWLSGANRKIHR